MPIEAGDNIYIQKADMVYVSGEVKKPGVYKCLSDTSVIKAITTAERTIRPRRGLMNSLLINRSRSGVQHMVASMNPNGGRVGVVMPHGVLFRSGQEKVIRECLLRSDRLEAVVGLAPNLFYSTSIPACLLIFRARSPE